MAKWTIPDMISRAEATRQTQEAVAAALMEAAEVAANEADYVPHGPDNFRKAIRALIPDAVRLLEERDARVRAEERERCAKVAETEGVSPATNVNQPADSWYRHGRRIAAAIRDGAGGYVGMPRGHRCEDLTPEEREEYLHAWDAEDDRKDWG